MAGIYAKAQRDPRSRRLIERIRQVRVSRPWQHPQQDASTERPASLHRARPRSASSSVRARGADPLAHPVDRGAEHRRRAGAGGADLERRQGARLGLGRCPPGARIRQAPGAAGKRDRPAAEPDPSLHQPAEPGTVRRDPAAARSRARHADHARRRPTRCCRARSRSSSSVTERFLDGFGELRAVQATIAKTYEEQVLAPASDMAGLYAIIEGATGHRDALIWPSLGKSREAFTAHAGRRQRLLPVARHRRPPRRPAATPRRSRRPSR